MDTEAEVYRRIIIEQAETIKILTRNLTQEIKGKYCAWKRIAELTNTDIKQVMEEVRNDGT